MTQGTGMTVGVLGAGTMGSGIATVMARAGHRTIVREPGEERVTAGLEQVRGFLDRSVELGKLDPGRRDSAVAGLSGATDLADLAGCDVVVEAVYEDVALKAELFGELDEVCGPDTLFHTNTSTLSVTAIAAGSSRPGRVVGTHYCNPAPIMKLVEVVKARQTGDDAYQRTVDFLAGLGKVTVTTGDSPGFIVNRFLIPFENGCIRALASGLGTAPSIDTAVTKGLGYPMGPFTLLDVVGLDIHQAVSLSLYEQLHDVRFAPPPLVDQMVAAGHLGRKTGRGFYTYEGTRAFGA
ncbi:MAG: 3-hydroxyacyl-CoA dehydrogenase family protein [Streptosporangiaceae bacterium]